MGFESWISFSGDQKVKLQVPRVRNISTNEEVPLDTYEQLQNAHQLDDMALSRVIHGMGQRNYEKAKARLNSIGKELKLINESALASLEEGLEDTLTLHRLGMYDKLGDSFKTTNCIENVNKQLATHTDRVDRWQNSNQRQRWVATTLLLIELRLKS